jgi:hypothetical protein
MGKMKPQNTYIVTAKMVAVMKNVGQVVCALIKIFFIVIAL